MVKKVETQRIDIRVPVQFLKEIEEYQIKHMISSRTQALLELARKGLELDKK